MLDKLQLQKLAKFGVPEEKLDQLQWGLVSFARENKHVLLQLVSAILPSDEEVFKAVESGGSLRGPSLKDHFRESIAWLQWLMFEEEPHTSLTNLAKLGVSQRGVCGAVWGKKDIAYRCRTCEHDATCAICVPCFQNGNHKDHDYSIIYTGGGCCDCGDVTAWKREGFCSKHKGAEQIQPLPEVVANSVGPVLDALLVYWRGTLFAAECTIRAAPRESNHTGFHGEAANPLSSVVVEMLLNFCNYSESLLAFVSRRMLPLVDLLDVLARSERFLHKKVVKKLHELLLKLLGEPMFKHEFAKAFINYYPIIVHEAIKEGRNFVFENYQLVATFSVQIFTVQTLTLRLVRELDLLGMLLVCLGELFLSCIGEGHLQVMFAPPPLPLLSPGLLFPNAVIVMDHRSCSYIFTLACSSSRHAVVAYVVSFVILQFVVACFGTSQVPSAVIFLTLTVQIKLYYCTEFATNLSSSNFFLVLLCLLFGRAGWVHCKVC